MINWNGRIPLVSLLQKFQPMVDWLCFGSLWWGRKTIAEGTWWNKGDDLVVPRKQKENRERGKISVSVSRQAPNDLCSHHNLPLEGPTTSPYHQIWEQTFSIWPLGTFRFQTLYQKAVSPDTEDSWSIFFKETDLSCHLTHLLILILCSHPRTSSNSIKVLKEYEEDAGEPWPAVLGC